MAAILWKNHSRAAGPRERRESADRDFALVRDAYERATWNQWKKSDSEAYNENGLKVSFRQACVTRAIGHLYSPLNNEEKANG